MHLVVNTAPALIVLDDDLDFAETVKRRYACRGYEALLWTEASETSGKPWDILLFKHSRSAEAQITSWLQNRSSRPEIEIIMLASEDVLGRAAELVPQLVTDLQRLPLNWLELDWRLHKARLRRQRQLVENPSRRSSLHPPAVAKIDRSLEQEQGDKPSSPAATVATLEDLQRAHVQSVLTREKWNKARTARALGVNRRSLYRLIERFGLKQGSTSG